MTTTTGFIGLGIMGSGMVRRLITQTGISTDPNSHNLFIWNRSASKSEALKAEFPTLNITICPTAADVITNSTTIYSMLSTPEASAGD